MTTRVTIAHLRDELAEAGRYVETDPVGTRRRFRPILDQIGDLSRVDPLHGTEGPPTLFERMGQNLEVGLAAIQADPDALRAAIGLARHELAGIAGRMEREGRSDG